MARTRRYQVAASGRWWDEEDNRWLPAGEVHAWEQGLNQTACGLSLHRSRLARFAAVGWSDVLPESCIRDSGRPAGLAAGESAALRPGRGIGGQDGSGERLTRILD